MMAASRLMVAPDDDTYYVIQLPRYAFVTDVWLNITTAYVGGAPTISVGFAGNGETANTAYFITTDISEPTVAGIKCSIKDTIASNRSKYFSNGSGSITVTIAAGSASTEGTFEVFAQYVLIS
jgi:hypothetical protein